MRLQVNRVAHPVTVLGPGRRLGIWVQGCHIGCPGCGSTDTWAPSGGQALDTEALALELAQIVVRDRLTGITLTGGEPTEQPDALADLLTRVRTLVGDQPDREQLLDILVFTGLYEQAARRRAGALFALVDLAIYGPYRADKPCNTPLIATSNQKLVALTPLGMARFSDLDEAANPALQVNVADGEITIIGLPSPGDLPRLEAGLRKRGITLGGSSWRTP